MAGQDRRSAAPEVDEQHLLDLLTEAQQTVPYRLPGVVNRCAELLGLCAATVYLVDLQQRLLIPLEDTVEPLSVEATEAGWAYRTLSVRVHETGGCVTVWIPLVDGAERLGVLSVRAGALDGTGLRRCRMLAAVLAMVVTSKRAYSDWFVARTRRLDMELPAEMLRAFLPPRSIGRAGVTSTAVLEPAYEISGDAFDHSLIRNVLYASIFDAMGHDLASGLTTAVAMAGCRSARRSGADLPDTVHTVDEALAQWLPDQFCTGVLCQLNIDAGLLRWCNCGHPPPLLIRGERVLDRALERAPQPPMGLPHLLGPARREVHETVLEPGDRVLLYTDGVTEARAGGTEFGLDRFADFIIRSAAAGQEPAEVLRLLIHAILDHQDHNLSDDATILLVEWRPPGR
ncbi:PP2C family protein-serine/threonine phosphatase [Peterkaempfera griseoplana]|uniref:PP2C family protein-serine/threonine phosphatase n=1 Tax=Peterkaempfera griseoplana TaxID=66896 RepID=UPI0006E23B20|nr:PP2C family protein-serine/threonine phosphatase [Peterkaempfera griseoplana]